jgi:hypothetical protein
MKDKKNIESSGLNEASSYKTVHIYSNFEEAEAAQIKKVACQSPEERIKETVELILRAYGVTREELKDRKTNNTVTIHRKA